MNTNQSYILILSLNNEQTKTLFFSADSAAGMYRKSGRRYVVIATNATATFHRYDEKTRIETGSPGLI